MNQRAKGCLPRPITYLVLMASLLGLLRSGCVMSTWALYELFGTNVLAVVEESTPYQSSAKPPGRALPITHYRGLYGFDLDRGTVSSKHIQGGFDTARFFITAGQEPQSGEKMPVKYLPLFPSHSCPADEFGIGQFLMALGLFIPSLLVCFLCLVFIYFGRASPAQDEGHLS